MRNTPLSHALSILPPGTASAVCCPTARETHTDDLSGDVRMNKKLLALAIGAAAAMPLVAQADGPTLYGKMNVTLDSIEDPSGAGSDAWYLNSNASRLGIKGDAEIKDKLKGIYYAEYEIDVDDGTTPFAQRNIYA